MRSTWLLFTTCVLLLVCNILPTPASANYLDDGAAEDDGIQEDYSENSIERLLQSAQKRACIRRGGNCDHRPNDCCYNSSCRCNLWGSNCRCQRMGLFQKWG